MADRPLSPGDIVAGKYRIESVLGEGGMGFVLGARNIALDEPVAIKILRPDAVTDGQAVARFFREARASVRMKGEHVAKVLDVGSLADGTPYMLMELLQGADLSAVVERHGRLAVHVAVDYVLQTCEALAEAHALGIVHRDIKPSNLFLTTGVDGLPCLKVLDFGISKATSAIDATRPDYGLTQTQTVMGSPQYMAPEQMRSSRRVDGRTDIWGLGTIMHELLTGSPPFVAETMPELFAMILQDPAPSLRTARPDVPPGLDAVVRRCLEKSPDARPADVLELARLLMPFAGPMSAGAAERVARVGRSVAFASASLIAERESSRAVDVAPLAQAGDAHPLGTGSRPMAAATLPAPAGSGPSSPELAHSNTTQMGMPTRPRPARGGTTMLVAALAPVLVVGVATAAFLALRHPEQSKTDDGRSSLGGATSVTSGVAPVEPPPPAVELPSSPALPSSGSTGSSVEPGAEGAAAAAATSTTTPSPGKRPGAGATVGAAGRPPPAPPGAASASARPAASAARTADPPKPAATASSRYD